LGCSECRGRCAIGSFLRVERGDLVPAPQRALEDLAGGLPDWDPLVCGDALECSQVRGTQESDDSLRPRCPGRQRRPPASIPSPHVALPHARTLRLVRFSCKANKRRGGVLGATRPPLPTRFSASAP
jgi:hypothetical protein